MQPLVSVMDPPDAIDDALSVGDYRTALSLCVRHHGRAIGRFCMALTGSQSDAEELAQDTFLAAHRGFASFRRESSLRGWLFGIARRVCAKHLERKVRRAHHLHLVGQDQLNHEPSVEAAQDIRRMRAAVATLKPSDRDVIALRYQAELSYVDIASCLDVTEPAARKRVSRALIALRLALASQEQT